MVVKSYCCGDIAQPERVNTNGISTFFIFYFNAIELIAYMILVYDWLWNYGQVFT